MTKSTPFSLAYGMEAMAPAEVNITSLRRSKMPKYVELNQEMMLDALDELKEKRDQALLRIQNYRNQIESYYNKKVRSRPLEQVTKTNYERLDPPRRYIGNPSTGSSPNKNKNKNPFYSSCFSLEQMTRVKNPNK